MKIGILGAPVLSPNMEGVLKTLGRMLYNNFELHLITGMINLPGSLTKYYIQHICSESKINPGSLLYACKACKLLVQNCNPNILLSIAQPQSLGYAISSIGQRKGVPNVVRMTGDSFGEFKLYGYGLKRLKKWFLHGCIAGLTYKKAGHILAIGEKLKNDLLERGFNPEKISVLPQPFDPGRFAQLNNEEKKLRKIELGLDPKKKTIFFAGRLSWLKGADRLLKIIKGVGSQSQDFQFCLVGQGEYEQQFKPFSPDLVQLPGKIPHEQIHLYFEAADLLVFPSRTEGLPNTILEALSCKVPVIASPVGDIPNWVSNLATDPKDYVKYILKRNWVLDGLPDTLQFDWLKQSYIDLFQKVIASGYESQKS